MLMTDPQPTDALRVDARAVGPRAALRRAAGAATCSRRAISCCGRTRREWDAVAASLGVAARSAAARQAGPRHPRRGRAPRRRRAWPRPAGRHHRHRRSRRSRSACASADCAPVLLYDPVTQRRRRGARRLARYGRRRGGARPCARCSEAFGIAARGSRRRDRAVPGRLLRGSRPRRRRRVPRRRRRRGVDRARGSRRADGDRSFLDLERANRDQLERAGLASGRDLRVRPVHEDPPRAAALVPRRRDERRTLLAAIRVASTRVLAPRCHRRCHR